MQTNFVTDGDFRDEDVSQLVEKLKGGFRSSVDGCFYIVKRVDPGAVRLCSEDCDLHAADSNASCSIHWRHLISKRISCWHVNSNMHWRFRRLPDAATCLNDSL